MYINLLRTFLGILLVSAAAIAQPDSLTFKSGEVVVGEIKLLDRSVITFKTTYSDSDFKIDWDAVVRISSNQYYLITLSDGRRFNGDLHSIGNTDQVVMKDGQIEYAASITDVVHLRPINDSF